MYLMKLLKKYKKPWIQNQKIEKNKKAKFSNKYQNQKLNVIKCLKVQDCKETKRIRIQLID